MQIYIKYEPIASFSQYCCQRSAVCAVADCFAVAWVFAIELDVAIFQVHEINEKCKNHDTRWERPGVQPGPAGQLLQNSVFINF